MHTYLLLTGFNPVHLVVGQSDFVEAFPTDEHPEVEFILENRIEKKTVSNDPNDSMDLSEEGRLHDTPIDETDRDSWTSEEDNACSKDVGIQCDLVDVLAMLAEYQKNANEDNMPLYVSAMNMTRDGTGMSMTEVSALNCKKFTFSCLLARASAGESITARIRSANAPMYHVHKKRRICFLLPFSLF